MSVCCGQVVPSCNITSYEVVGNNLPSFVYFQVTPSNKWFAIDINQKLVPLSPTQPTTVSVNPPTPDPANPAVSATATFDFSKNLQDGQPQVSVSVVYGARGATGTNPCTSFNNFTPQMCQTLCCNGTLGGAGGVFTCGNDPWGWLLFIVTVLVAGAAIIWLATTRRDTTTAITRL